MIWHAEREELVGAASLPAAAPPLSPVDRLASPRGFVAQLLVYNCDLDAADLRAALARVVELMPELACRAVADEAGDWRLAVPPEAPAAGALLIIGSSPATLADLGCAPPGGDENVSAAAPTPPRHAFVNRGAGMFGPPGAAPAQLPLERAASLRAPLLAVARYSLAGGGAALGVRASHMVADFGTVAAAIYQLAAAAAGFTGAPAPSPPPPAPRPAAPVLAALAAARSPLPDGFRPFNYLPVPDGWGGRAAEVFSRPAPKGAVYRVPAARLAELKRQAIEDVARLERARLGEGQQGSEDAAGEGGDESGGGEWVSTHDALMARLWMAVAALPARAGANPFPLTLGLDMRGRLPPDECGCSIDQQAALYGNLATTLYVPAVDMTAAAAAARGDCGPSLGEVALEIRRALGRCVALFPDDLAHGAALASTPGACAKTVILPFLDVIDDAAAGRAPLLMTSSWMLDFKAASFGGREPALAAPSLDAVFPLAVPQPAPGGGVDVNVWLWEPEFSQLMEAVPQL